MIAAMASNRIVGKENKLPRHYPVDLQHFKKITSGQIIVMGYTTFISIGKALPNRRNIILSQDPVEGMEWYGSIDAMMEQLTREDSNQIFIIG